MHKWEKRQKNGLFLFTGQHKNPRKLVSLRYLIKPNFCNFCYIFLHFCQSKSCKNKWKTQNDILTNFWSAQRLWCTWSSCKMALIMWVVSWSVWRLNQDPLRYLLIPYTVAFSDRLIRSGLALNWSGPLIQFSRIPRIEGVNLLITSWLSLTWMTEKWNQVKFYIGCKLFKTKSKLCICFFK